MLVYSSDEGCAMEWPLLPKDLSSPWDGDLACNTWAEDSDVEASVLRIGQSTPSATGKTTLTIAEFRFAIPASGPDLNMLPSSSGSEAEADGEGKEAPAVAKRRKKSTKPRTRKGRAVRKEKEAEPAVGPRVSEENVASSSVKGKQPRGRRPPGKAAGSKPSAEAERESRSADPSGTQGPYDLRRRRGARTRKTS